MARVVAGAPVVVRRSRGYVPRGIAARDFSEPVLACGALLKNTFCLGVDGTAYLGPHIGDLENLETFEAYEHAIGRMERFLGARPAVIAHDLHPDYLSTRYALDRPEPLKVAVQHHHAHVCAAMAEHGMSGPVIGVAYDGTGLGTDGQAWGGEILVADSTRFTRIATFRPIRLAGGDLAIRQVWRQALALVDDAFDGDAPLDRFALFGRVPPRDMAAVRAMLAHGVNTPAAHGVGRYFDAIGALALGKAESRFEGQVAVEWNLAADPNEDGQYRFAVADGPGLRELDLRPAIRTLTGELVSGVSPAAVSARFHNTLAAATVALIEIARRRCGALPAVLTGGVFQNALLVERVLRAAGPAMSRAAARTGAAGRRRPGAWAGRHRQRRRRRRAGGKRGGRMCLGVPGKVVAIDGNCATVDFWGVRRQVLLDVVDEPVAVGDYVLNHVGYAIRRIPESEIGETLALFEQLLGAGRRGRPQWPAMCGWRSPPRERCPMPTPFARPSAN